jgi:hypothetical protein
LTKKFGRDRTFFAFSASPPNALSASIAFTKCCCLPPRRTIDDATLSEFGKHDRREMIWMLAAAHDELKAPRVAPKRLS